MTNTHDKSDMKADHPLAKMTRLDEEIGKLLLHGTLTLSGSQIIVDFNNRENAEAFFDALESTIHQSEEE